MSDLSAQAVPRFTRGHRLREDKARDVWVIQAPEKAYVADPIATAVLRLVDGAQTVSVIVDRLAEAYQAPRDVIQRDVLALLDDLIERRVLAL